MKNNIISLTVVLIAFTLTGCQSIPGPESRFDYHSYSKDVKVTLNAPNLSNIHRPPLFSLAYVKVYELEDVCSKEKTIFGETYQQADPIGEIYVSKADKSKVGKLPVGNIVIQSGLDLGLSSGSDCGRYFMFTTRENFEYEIEVKESRPFLVSCYVTVREKDAEGRYSPALTNFRHSTDGNFFNLKEDMSPLCGDDGE